jgi:hypothetical protein
MNTDFEWGASEALAAAGCAVTLRRPWLYK